MRNQEGVKEGKMRRSLGLMLDGEDVMGQSEEAELALIHMNVPTIDKVFNRVMNMGLILITV